MARLYYGHVVVDQIKIHYYRTGDEKPPILFLHGLTDSGLCWNEVALALEPYYDVILMDARGHGLSDKPEHGYGPDERVKDVTNLMQELSLEKIPLVGHSIGAETAAMVAAKFPQKVKCLVLEDPPFWADSADESETARNERAERFRQSIQQNREMSLDDLIAKGKEQYPQWSQTEFFQWAKAKKHVSPNVVNGIPIPRPSWRDYAKEIKCPVLLFTGDPEEGAIVTPEVAQEASKGWKKSKVVHIPGAGHNIRRDRSGDFLDELKTFFRKHYPY